MPRRFVLYSLLLLIPSLGFSQIVISGTGQLLRYNAANISVGGNWTNNAAGTGGYTGINVTGGVIFAGTAAQTIAGTTITSFTNFGISNTAGVTVSSIDINITALTFFDGILTIVAPNKVNIPDNGIMSPGKTSSFVNGTVAKTGNDAFIFEVGDGTKYAPIGISAPGSLTDVFEGTYINFPAPDGGNIPVNIELVSGFEYWNLQRTNGSANVNVTLYWKNSQESEIGADLTHLFIVHHDGINTWDLATNGGTSGSGDLNSVQSGSITGGPYTSFGYFTFGSDNSTLTPLPVELISFSVRKHLASIELIWATASEFNSDYFTIEKSVNAEDWQEISLIEAQGCSTSRVDYSFTDKYPYLGNQYYRLKQVDFDGTTTYSETLLVNHEGVTKAVFDVYPNPLKDKVLQISSPSLAGISSVFLIDGNGHRVEVTYQATSRGKYQVDLALPAGVYIMIINTEKAQFRQRIVKL